MATKQHNSSKNTRKFVQSSSKRSEWAAYMHGADPEWLDTREARNLAVVFDGHFPAWLIESEPWQPVTPEGFRFLRSFMLRLSAEQCGAYLGVHRSTICRWESGDAPITKAAYEVLRLLVRTTAQRLSHKHWDGWFINRDGELVSPDHNRLTIKPSELNGLPALYGRLSALEQEIARQEDEIGFLRAENNSLRRGFASSQATAELQAMQERINKLLAGLNTAAVIEFNKPACEQRRVA